jgi:hypothetical protein
VQIKLLDGVLTAVHSLFNRSPKRQKQWGLFAARYGVTSVKFPLFNKTRWLSRHQCLEVVLRCLPVLIRYLTCVVNTSDDDKWVAAALKVLSMLEDKQTLFILHCAADLLDPVNWLNTSFQSDNLLPHHVPLFVDTAVADLHKLLTSDGKYLKVFQAGLWESADACDWIVKVGGKFKVTIHLDTGSFSAEALSNFRQEFVSSFVKGLEERFADRELLSAFKVLDPLSYHEVSLSDAKGMFKRELEVLMRQFIAGKREGGLPKEDAIITFSSKADLDSFYVEAFQMKKLMLEKMKLLPGITARTFWAQVRSSKQEHQSLSRMLDLACVMLVVCIGSASVERGFSLHKAIKSAKRNRLTTASVDSLMRVSILVDRESWLVPGEALEQSTMPVLIASAVPHYDGGKSVLRELHQRIEGLPITDRLLAADADEATALLEELAAEAEEGEGEGEEEWEEEWQAVANRDEQELWEVEMEEGEASGDLNALEALGLGGGEGMADEFGL